MTVTRDQTATGQAVTNPTSVVIAWPTLPTAGSKVLIGLALGAGSVVSVSSAVDNGTTPTTFTADIAVASGSSSAGKYILRADNITLPSSGSYHVTITLSGTASWATGSGRSYLGVATGGPTSAPAAATGTSGSVATPNVTPALTGALLFGVFDDDSGQNPETITLTTSGANSVYVNTNGVLLCGAVADKVATTTSAQGLAWSLGDTPDWGAWIAVYSPAPTSHPASAALSGSGTLTAGGLVTQPGSATLSGTGTLTPAASTSVIAGSALAGTGSLTAGGTVAAPGAGSANLDGSGTLTVSRQVTYQQAVPLSGSGSLSATETGLSLESVPLSGSGTLTVTPAASLQFTAGLFGAGFLSVPQVAGGLVAGIGGASTPMALPGSSQVAVAPPGSSNWQWLGTLGQVTALTYSYVCPGGADKMTCTVMAPASYQSQFFYPGWQVKIVRGGMDIWHGKLDQPSYQPHQGWTLTAVGNGNRGQDFTAYFTSTWPANQPDEVISQAISRGLPWVSPGYNSASFASQFWLGQSVDAGAQTVTAFLNMITSRGGLTWYVNSAPGGLYAGDNLQIFPLPTVPTRLLVCTTPVPRTLGGYTNYLLIRFQSSADNATTGTTATYAYTTATNPRSIAAHGQIEAYFDIGDAPVMTAAAAQNVGNLVLQSFVAASYTGPFTVSYGQLLNMGGQAVDIAVGQAGIMAKLVLADSAYGGSVDASVPVTFIIGSYEYDDVKQVATIQPYQTVSQSLSGVMSAEHATLMPVTVAAN